MCEPVSVGLAVTASMTTAGAAGAGAIAAGVAAAAATGAAWGVAIGGVTNLMTGRGFFENAGRSALIGAVSGGVAGVAGHAGNIAGTLSGVPGFLVSHASTIGMAAGGATALATGALSPETPDYSQFGYGAQPYEPQGYSSQHAQVTGSGGRQAAAVLASEIKQAKSRRKRQAEASESFGLDMDLAGTGLQIA